MMHEADFDIARGRFAAFAARMCASADVDSAWTTLANCYAAPPRAYHNLSHIVACLTIFDSVRSLAVAHETIEAAIWFHDCIYDPQRSENEARSADTAREILAEWGLPARYIACVVDLILATKHTDPPGTRDAELLVDVDLSILGAEREEFDRYESAIREEYAHVPDAAFATGRAAILRRFLESPAIYHTDWFRTRFEQRARSNLHHSIRKLTM